MIYWYQLGRMIKLHHAFINKYEFINQKFIEPAGAIETFHRQNHNNDIILFCRKIRLKRKTL